MTRVALTLHEGSEDRVLAGSYHASLRRTRQSGGQPEYWDASFSARAKTFSMTLPRLHLVAMNRSTTYRRRSARAFQKMFDNIRKTVAVQGSVLPDRFSHPLDGDMFLEIPDAHTVAIVASHLGTPIGQLRVGKYDLDGESTQLNKNSLERYQASIRKLVELL